MSKLWHNIDREREEQRRKREDKDRNVELEQWRFRSAILFPFWTVARNTGCEDSLFHDIEIVTDYPAPDICLAWWKVERLGPAEDNLRAKLQKGNPTLGDFWDRPLPGPAQDATLQLMHEASVHGDEAVRSVLLWACAIQRHETQHNALWKRRTTEVIDAARAFLQSQEDARWNWNAGSKYVLPTWPETSRIEDVDLASCVRCLGEDAALLLSKWRPVRVRVENPSML